MRAPHPGGTNLEEGFQLGGRQMTFAEGGGQSSPSPVGLRTKCLKPGRGSPHQAGPQLSLPGVGWGAVFMSIWALLSWQGSMQGPTPLAQPHPAMELSLQPAGLAVGAGVPDQRLVRGAGVHESMIYPLGMHGCENWTMKKAERQRIDAFELWCWRRLFRAPWTARSIFYHNITTKLTSYYPAIL